MADRPLPQLPPLPEEETRTLAEEIALIRTQLEERSVIPERDAPATEISPKVVGDD